MIKKKILLAVFIVLFAMAILVAEDPGNLYPGPQWQQQEQPKPPQPNKPDETPDHWVTQLRHVFMLAEKNLFEAGFILKMKNKISLSEKQELKIETIMMAYQESCIRNGAEIKIRELCLASYIKSDQIDKAVMAGYIREISGQKTDWVVRYFNYLLDLREILTTKQLAILATLANANKTRPTEQR